jgi:hypothetical protein
MTLSTPKPTRATLPAATPAPIESTASRLLYISVAHVNHRPRLTAVRRSVEVIKVIVSL